MKKLENNTPKTKKITKSKVVISSNKKESSKKINQSIEISV